MNVINQIKQNKRKLVVLFIIYFLAMYSFNMAHVVTPTFISQYYHKNNINTGDLYAIMSLGSTLSMPIWGNLVDRIGRKKVLLVTVFIYGFFQIGFGFSRGNIYGLVICRLMAGLVGGQAFRVAARSYVTDITDLEGRTHGLSTLIVFDSLSMALAYLSMGYADHLIGLIAHTDYHAWMIMILQGGFCFFVTLVIALVVKESQWVSDQKTHRSWNVFKNVAHDLRNVRHTGLIVLLLLTIPAAITRTSSKMIDVYLTSPDELGHSPLYLGMIYTGIGITSTIFVFLIFPKIKKYLQDTRWLLLFGLLSSIFLTIGWTTPHIVKHLHFFPFIYIFQSLFDMCNQLFLALIISYISKIFNKNYGSVMGLTNIAFTFASIIGPVGLNWLLVNTNTGTYIFDIVACCSVFSAVSIYVYINYLNRKNPVPKSVPKSNIQKIAIINPVIEVEA